MIVTQIYRYLIVSLLAFLLGSTALQAQKREKLPFFQPADTLVPVRFWTSLATGAGAYTGTMIGLSQVWYAEYPQSKFHFFNDWGEWENMDKMGHAYTTYLETSYGFQILSWTGLKRRKALWMGAGMALLFQASFETLDGFSEKWGFSLPDIGFNTLGAGLFVAQELLWQQQRITFKISSNFQNYASVGLYSVDGNHYTTLSQRAQDLYGGSLPARFLKDYNAQSVWLSANIHSFLPQQENKFPRWLNIAVGYGAENMFGGYENEWQSEGVDYVLDPVAFPRYRQFFLSLDVDFSRIRCRNRFLKTLLRAANVIKVPAPTIEFNSLGKVRFHPLYL